MCDNELNQLKMDSHFIFAVKLGRSPVSMEKKENKIEREIQPKPSCSRLLSPKGIKQTLPNVSISVL